MKIRCACGVKYEFDVTPEMWQNPVRFVCTSCGLDSSEYVNQLVREEIAESFPDAVPKPAAPVAPPPAAPRLKISREEKPPEAAAPAPAPVVRSAKYCHKHHAALATDKCIICGKSICPKCMEEFGYFCSPFCQNKADLQGIQAPVYAGQKFEVQRQFWRKTGLVIGGLVGAVILFFGVWTWYAWFGSVPHKYFAVRFEDTDRAYAGRTQLVGRDQLVFLHGGTLARYDLKAGKPVWTQELITKEDIAAAVKRESQYDAESNAGGGYQHHRNADTIEREVKIGLQSLLQMRVSGENIWIGKMVELPPAQPDAFPETACRLTHYDWATGKIKQELVIPTSRGEMLDNGDELLLLKHTEVGAQFVTHVSLKTGEQRMEEFHDPGATLAIDSSGGASPKSGSKSKTLDPQKMGAQAQNLQLPARIALPALIAGAAHEQQLEAELKEDGTPKPGTARQQKRIAERFQLIPSNDGYLQFAWHLIEAKYITHEAMKAPPKKSALDNANLNVTQTAEVANDMLNEMQRNNGGSTVTEDVSRYQVSIRRADAPDLIDWTGEVVGTPALFPLKTVNVLVAGKTVIVFDKSNKKLWEASLLYAINGAGGFRGDESPFGAGPCVEHGDTLYVFDPAMLNAFALNTGDARWRVPSVGVVGLFFDDAGDIYVNTTTGNPDDIKYSRQIDVNKQTQEVLLKLDPKTGKTLWSAKPGGFVSYLKGKFIYAVQAFDPNPTDEEQVNDIASSLMKPPFLRIVRINPKNGRILFEYYDRDRCPFDVRFDENSIQLVFKREVQVLRYLTF